MLTVAIVWEAVLAPEAVTFREIQPDFDALQRKEPGVLGPGWQGVRAFLARPSLQVAAATTRPSIRSSRFAITSVLIALPRESTETWLLAVHTKKKSLEEIADPAAELVGAGLIDSDDQRMPLKKRARYAALAVPLAVLVADGKKMAKTLPELSRLASKLRARARAVKKGTSR